MNNVLKYDKICYAIPLKWEHSFLGIQNHVARLNQHGVVGASGAGGNNGGPMVVFLCVVGDDKGPNLFFLVRTKQNPCPQQEFCR